MKSDIFYCVCNQDGNVIEQSSACLKLCGDRQGITCTDGCREHLNLIKKEKVSQVLPNRYLHNNWYDITKSVQGEFQIIMLTSKEENRFTEIDLRPLTSKEKEIAKLIKKGLQNKEIMKELNITKATLKSHINHIYQKLNLNLQNLRKS